MAGDHFMYESMWGASQGYADVGDFASYGDDAMGDTHTHFLVWLVVFALAAISILGGLKVGGFHFVVKV